MPARPRAGVPIRAFQPMGSFFWARTSRTWSSFHREVSWPSGLATLPAATGTSTGSLAGCSTRVRLRAAGGILLGKTNTPEFTWSDETDNAVYGRTNNPYDLTRTPGGSSGGPVALVATGGSPFDVGSDTGNSIRMPAHYCGVAGLKATHGRIPKTGHAISYRGIMESWTQLGPIARTVDDLARLLPILAGIDDEDPYGMPVPLLDSRRVAMTGLRVVFFTDNGVKKPTPETAAVVRAAAAALQKAGARIEERLPAGLDRANELWHEIAGADGGAWLKRLLEAAGTPNGGTVSGWFADAKPVAAERLTQLVEQLDEVRGRLRRGMEPVDLIVCPAMRPRRSSRAAPTPPATATATTSPTTSPAGRSRWSGAAPRPRVCRSECSAWRKRGVKTWRSRPRRSSKPRSAGGRRRRSKR